MFTKENAAEIGARSKRGISERTRILNDLFNEAKAKEVFAMLQAKAIEGDMDAIKTYLAYCFGKPKETVDLNLPGGINIIFKKVETENSIHLLPMSNGTTNGTGN